MAQENDGRTEPTAYEVLGVPEDAGTGEIQRARKALLFQLHPDRLGALPTPERNAHEERFKQVEAAFALVKSRRRRWYYNEQLRRGRVSRQRPEAQPPATPQRPARERETGAGRVVLALLVLALLGALALAALRRPQPVAPAPVEAAPVAQAAPPTPQRAPADPNWRRPGDGSYDLVEKTAQLYGLPSDLLLAVIAAESGGDPAHRAPDGRVGLMGLPEGPGAGLPGDLADPGTNLLEGALRLRDLIDAHGGDLSLALAAWHRGPEEVARRGGVPSDAETTGYLQKVLGGYAEARPASARRPSGSPGTPDAGGAGAAPLLEGSFRSVSFGWTPAVVERALVPARRGLAWESHTCLFRAVDLAGRTLDVLDAPEGLRCRTLFDVDAAWGQVVAWYAKGRLVALQAASKSPQERLIRDLSEAYGGEPVAATFSSRWRGLSQGRDTWCWRAPGLTACVIAAGSSAGFSARARPVLWLTSDKAEAAAWSGASGDGGSGHAPARPR
jgi:soluble lytic murein transglycosylase-like protein